MNKFLLVCFLKIVFRLGNIFITEITSKILAKQLVWAKVG